MYLTVNPVEYHGPHLSLHNDRLISLGLVRDLHDRLGKRHEWPLLLATDLEIGVEPCPGLGTRPTSFLLARTLITEACRSLAELGATKVVLMTFHGAPLHSLAIEAGARWLRGQGIKAIAPFNALMHELLWLEPAAFEEFFAFVEEPAEREALRQSIAWDFHAGFLETSLSLHYAPASVAPDYVNLPPCPAVKPHRGLALAATLAQGLKAETTSRELHFAAIGLGWYGLRPFPGYSGRPHLASAQAGALFAERIAKRFEEVALAAFDGEAAGPKPIMPWLEALTCLGMLLPTMSALPRSNRQFVPHAPTAVPLAPGGRFGSPAQIRHD